MNADDRAVKAHALEMLKKYLRKGDTIYCALRSISRSGLSRQITAHCVDHDTLRVVWIGGYVAQVLGLRMNHARDRITTTSGPEEIAYEIGRAIGLELRGDWL